MRGYRYQEFIPVTAARSPGSTINVILGLYKSFGRRNSPLIFVSTLTTFIACTVINPVVTYSIAEFPSEDSPSMGKQQEEPVITTYSQVACIGAGFSGIGVGATLYRWYGITDVQLFERRASAGGTWYANTYPGTKPEALYHSELTSFFRMCL